MFIHKLFFIAVGFSCISYSTQESLLKVSLFYESYCPYCHDFFLNQLYPGYTKLGDSITVDLVSFGKMSANETDNGIEWTCQHGPLECYLNKVHACVIENNNLDQATILSYINCTLASTHNLAPEDNAKQCANEANLSWDDIYTCITDGTGDKLLFAFEAKQKALDPPLSYVPHIIFNDKFDEEQESNARFNFLWTACNLINGTKPSACAEF